MADFKELEVEGVAALIKQNATIIAEVLMEFQQRVDSIGLELISIDISSEEGRLQMIRAQGKAASYAEILNILIGCLEEQEKENGSEPRE